MYLPASEKFAFFRIYLVFCLWLGPLQMWKLENMLIHRQQSDKLGGGLPGRGSCHLFQLTFFHQSCLLLALLPRWLMLFGDTQRLPDSPFLLFYVFPFHSLFVFANDHSSSLLSPTHRFSTFSTFPLSAQLLPRWLPRWLISPTFLTSRQTRGFKRGLAFLAKQHQCNRPAA